MSTQLNKHLRTRIVRDFFYKIKIYKVVKLIQNFHHFITVNQIIRCHYEIS